MFSGLSFCAAAEPLFHQILPMTPCSLEMLPLQKEQIQKPCSSLAVGMQEKGRPNAESEPCDGVHLYLLVESEEVFFWRFSLPQREPQSLQSSPVGFLKDGSQVHIYTLFAAWLQV